MTPTAIPGEILLKVRAEESVSGLTLEFAYTVAAVDNKMKLLADRHRIVLPPLDAGKDTSFLIRYAR